MPLFRARPARPRGCCGREKIPLMVRHPFANSVHSWIRAFSGSRPFRAWLAAGGPPWPLARPIANGFWRHFRPELADNDRAASGRVPARPEAPDRVHWRVFSAGGYLLSVWARIRLSPLGRRGGGAGRQWAHKAGQMAPTLGRPGPRTQLGARRARGLVGPAGRPFNCPGLGSGAGIYCADEWGAPAGRVTI